ncbi:MAG: choice-of-anchor J domain-containing protein [Bacteroides sp.]|jgi:hypothetical protein|nr:choice-of-anchor J domain-containing protein [Bacteroides sp.]
MKRITFFLLVIFAGFVAFSQGPGDLSEAEKLQIENMKPDVDAPVMVKSGASQVLPGVQQPVKPLFWHELDAPKSAPEWIHWDSGVNDDAIGTGGAADFAVAARFDPTDLAGYAGTAITRIQFVPYVASAVYTLKVWQGTNPPTEVYSQAVSTVTIEAWNDIELTTPVNIDASQELWIGYTISTTTGYPAGCDAGPQVAGKGNMIYWEGVWQELTDLGALPYNWNIQGYVEVLADPGAPAAPLNLAAVAGAAGALEVSLSWDNPALTVSGETLTDLDFIYVYRGAELIHTITDPTIGAAETFVDNALTEGGFVSYSVYGSNDLGDGPGASAVVFVGPDVPAAPGDVTLVAQGNDGYVTWTAPTEGFNGGYLDPAGMTYTVVRMPDGVEVATDITALEYTDATVPGIGNYYYVVTASNAVGEGGSAASNVALLGAEGILMYEVFDYATGALPPGWMVEGLGQTNWSVVATANAGGTSPELRLGWSPAFVGLSRLISYPVNVEGYSALRFKYKQYLNDYSGNEGEIAAIDVSYDGGTTWTALWEEEIIASIPAGDYELYLNVPDGATTVHFGFRFNGDAYNINYWYFDNMILEPVLEHDLIGEAITGNATPSVGTESIYTVAVKNAGTMTATDYTVKLMQEGGVELASVAGTAIEFGETLTFDLAWTPQEADEGNTFVYGVVEFTADEMPGNNQTPNLNLTVQGADVIAVTIGTGTAYPSSRIPFDFFYKNSFSQTLYFPDELGLGGGVLTGLGYTNNFQTNLPGKPIKVWVGETDATDLSAGWVPLENLTLVYDGTLDFPTGENSIIIPFQQPYVYTGGNLVVYTNRVWEDQYFSSLDRFYGTLDDGSSRTRRLSADGTAPLDPANPGTGSVIHWHPNTTLYFSTAGLGAMEGMVTDGTNPLEGVDVSVVGTMASTVTDATGYYSFPYLLPGTYDVHFELFGFTSYLAEDVLIVEDETTVVDAVMAAIPQYAVNGVIEGNDDVLLEGAEIWMEGYEDYYMMAGVGGVFMFPEVYAGSYDVTISMPGYEVHTAVVNVDADLDLGTIVLTEILAAPYGVSIDPYNQGDGNALLTWNSAEMTMLYQHDGAIPAEPNAFYQSMDNGYGVVYDLTAFPDAVVEAIDFHHLQWGLPNGTYPYLVHIINWETKTIIETVGPINTLVNDAWEEAVDLGAVSVAGLSQVAILIQPQGNTAADAYPDITTDATGPNGVSLQAPMSDLNNFTINGSTVGDFFINLWISTAFAPDKVVKAQMLTADQVETASRLGTALSSTEATINNQTIVAPEEEKIFDGFNIYLNDMEIPMAEGVEVTEYLFTGLEEGTYTAGVSALYTTGMSEIVTVDFVIAMGVEVTVDVTTNSGDSSEGALVHLANQTETQFEYTGTVGADGSVVFETVRKGMYTMTVTLGGYEEYVEADINIQDVATLTAELIEIIVDPYGLMVVEGETAGEATFSWNNATGWGESFETGAIPEGWTQIITNTAGGTLPTTWAIVGTIEFTSGDVVPQDGDYQAFMYWDYGHQDEWLITPAFTAPAGDLTFWYYGHNGSVNLDHYYVKISTDGGDTWTVLWDASTLPEADNHYATPAVIDLSAYVGQEVHIAWQNVDGDGQGMWYAWAIDNITVGDMRIDVKDLIAAPAGNIQQGENLTARDGVFYPSVNPADMIPAPRKSFEGYNVYLDDMVTPVATSVANTEFLFTGLANGDYVAGVQSVYSSGASEVITLPFTIENGVVSETYQVTFNVHMHEVEYTETDVIYMTGSMLDWTTPGDDPDNQTMEETGDPNIMTHTLELEAGTYAYKYFMNAGWDGGEWAGAPDREIVVAGDMTVDDVFGNINNPVEVPTVDAGELLVYPNPARDMMHIVSGEMIREVRIIDMLGQVVYTSDVQGERHEVNVGGFRNGIYFVQVLTSKGLTTQRIQIAK